MPDTPMKLAGVLVGGVDDESGWDGVREKLHDLYTSLVRTLVPILAGFVASFAARRGLHIEQAKVAIWLTPVLQGAWYTVPRLLEPRFPWMGWFLGLAKQPAYSPQPAPTPAPEVVEVTPDPAVPDIAAVPPAPEPEPAPTPEPAPAKSNDPHAPHDFRPRRDDVCTLRGCGLQYRAKVHHS